MYRRKLKAGDLVRIDTMTTVPEHRRIYKVVRQSTQDTVVVCHVLSGMEMEIADHVCTLLPDKPDTAANLDCLVGRKVRVMLTDGNRFQGTCTGVLYHGIDLFGETAKQVSRLEFDGSQGTTFGWHEVKSIEAI